MTEAMTEGIHINLASIPVYYITLNGKSTLQTLRRLHTKRLCNKHFATVHEVIGVDGRSQGLLGRTAVALALAKAISQALLVEPFQPFLILQDDVDMTMKKLPPLALPKETDACFLGLSWAASRDDRDTDGGKIRRVRINDDLFQIGNMLTEHAILFVSKAFALAYYGVQIESAAQAKYGDVVAARLQSCFNVYAMAKPLFYQAKWLGGKEEETNLDWSKESSTCTREQLRTTPQLTSLVLTCRSSSKGE